MIRQVRAAKWREIVASKPDPSSFLAEFDAYRSGWAARKQGWAAKWKGNLGSTGAQAEKAALQSEAETAMLGYGFYESVTEAQENNEFLASVLNAAKSHPSLVLSVVTRIANHYRNQQGKADLTETQVKTRLLA